jgi:hypothetical protein
MAESSTSFQEGQSGNPKGRPKKGETITDLVKEYLNKKVPNQKEKLTYKDLFVKKVLEKAYMGDPQAIKMIWNYSDGMPVQTNKIEYDSEKLDKIREWFED